MSENRERGSGKYAPSVDRPCACGHNLGAHTASRVRGPDGPRQECLEDGCGCECFKRGKLGAAPEKGATIRKALSELEAVRSLVRAKGKALQVVLKRHADALRKEADARPEPKGIFASDPVTDKLIIAADSVPDGGDVDSLSSKDTWDDALGEVRRWLRNHGQDR